MLPLVSAGPALTSAGPAFLGGVNCNGLLSLARPLGVVRMLTPAAFPIG